MFVPVLEGFDNRRGKFGAMWPSGVKPLIRTSLPTIKETLETQMQSSNTCIFGQKTENTQIQNIPSLYLSIASNL